MNIDKILELGNLWEVGNKKRIYITDLVSLFGGIEYETYKISGMVKRATVDGEAVSNAKATSLIGELKTAKFWYDFEDGKLHYKGNYSRLFTTSEIFNRLACALRDRCV